MDGVEDDAIRREESLDEARDGVQSFGGHVDRECLVDEGTCGNVLSHGSEQRQDDHATSDEQADLAALSPTRTGQHPPGRRCHLAGDLTPEPFEIFEFVDVEPALDT